MSDAEWVEDFIFFFLIFPGIEETKWVQNCDDCFGWIQKRGAGGSISPSGFCVCSLYLVFGVGPVFLVLLEVLAVLRVCGAWMGLLLGPCRASAVELVAGMVNGIGRLFFFSFGVPKHPCFVIFEYLFFIFFVGGEGLGNFSITVVCYVIGFVLIWKFGVS